MTQYKSWLLNHLHQVCEQNPFVSLLEMQITNLGEGVATITIPTIAEKHTNPYGFVHGGALTSMADTAMGIACSTTGNRVWTIEMNTNFIKNVLKGSKLIAVGKVIHTGKTTMVAEAEIWDEDQQLLVKGRGTFFIVGRYEKSPLKS